jgi:hypothetical protein
MEEHTIDEWRHIYSIDDKTPNEKRFINENIYDERIFFPYASVYPFVNPGVFLEHIILPVLHLKNEEMIKKDYFEFTLKHQQIDYAVMYLQIEVLKKFIHSNKDCLSKYFKQIFVSLFSCVYPYKYNQSAYNEIAKILFENCDDAIAIILSLQNYPFLDKKKDYKDVIQLLFDFLPIDENNVCKYCLTTEPRDRLIKLCDCKNLVHIECLMKWNDVRNLVSCEICKVPYKINDKYYHKTSITSAPCIDERLYFPFNDLYPVNISSDKIIAWKNFDRLRKAIEYLQVDRVKDLLKEKEILDELPQQLFGYEGYNQTPLIKLCTGNVGYNNMVYFGDNAKKYKEIIYELLKTRKIDFGHKDVFGKSAFDYDKELAKFTLICLSKLD